LNAYNADLYIKDCIFGRGLYPETLQPIAETADKGELKKNLNIVTEQQEQNTDIERADKQLAEDVCNFVNNELAEDEPLSFEAVEHSILRSDGRAIDDMRIQSALYTVRNKNKDRKMSYEYLKSEELIGFVEACYKKNSEKVVSNDSKQIEAARRR
jgi:hypothetical protein